MAIQVVAMQDASSSKSVDLDGGRRSAHDARLRRTPAPPVSVSYASEKVRRGEDVRECRGTAGRQGALAAARRAPRRAATAAAAGPAGSRACRRRSRPPDAAGSYRTCSRQRRPPAAPRSRTSGSRRHGGARRQGSRRQADRWPRGSIRRRRCRGPACPLLPAGRSTARRRVCASARGYHQRARPARRFGGPRQARRRRLSRSVCAPIAWPGRQNPHNMTGHR